MAKLIRFDLPMNGTKVKTLDELRDNMTVEILEHYKTGRLEKWLRMRGYDGELTGLKQVADENDASLLKRLFDIFGIEADDFVIAAILKPEETSNEINQLVINNNEESLNSEENSEANIQEKDLFHFSDDEIKKLFSSSPEDDLLRDVKLQKLPKELEDKLIETGGERVQTALASNLFLTRQAQMTLAQIGTSNIREELAANPSLLESVQIYLFDTGSYGVRLALAKNQSICEEIQALLSKDEHQPIRYDLAGNKGITAKIQSALTDDDDVWVKSNLAENDALSHELQEKLANEKNEEINCGLAKNVNLSKKLMSILVDELNDKVRLSLAANIKLSEPLQARLIRDTYGSDKVRVALAKNIALGVAQQAELASSKHYTDVLVPLFFNPSLHNNVKSLIIQYYSEQELIDSLSDLKSEYEKLAKEDADVLKTVWELSSKSIDNTIKQITGFGLSALLFNGRIESKINNLEKRSSEINKRLSSISGKIDMFEAILKIKKN